MIEALLTLLAQLFSPFAAHASEAPAVCPPQEVVEAIECQQVRAEEGDTLDSVLNRVKEKCAHNQQVVNMQQMTRDIKEKYKDNAAIQSMLNDYAAFVAPYPVAKEAWEKTHKVQCEKEFN